MPLISISASSLPETVCECHVTFAVELEAAIRMRTKDKVVHVVPLEIVVTLTTCICLEAAVDRRRFCVYII